MFLRLWRWTRRLASHLLHLRFGAFAGELKSALRRPAEALRALRHARVLKRALDGRVAGRRVIVFPPTLDWHLPLYQRPQHLPAPTAKRKTRLCSTSRQTARTTACRPSRR